MANYTSAPDGDYYDVLIEGSLNDSETEPCDHYDPKVLSAQLVPLLYIAVFLAGLLGNGLVLLVLVKYKELRHVENIYFLNLAVANLCSLLTLPFWIHSAFHAGLLADPTCTVLAALSSVGLYGEALFSVLLTVFFHKSRFSSSARKVPCAAVTSVVTWAAAILATLPEFLFYRPQAGSQEHKCFFSRLHFVPGDDTFWAYFLTLRVNIVALLVPLLVLIVCCVRTRKTPRSREKNRDLPKLVFAVVTVFLLMWGPYSTALFLSTFKAGFSLHGCKRSYKLDRSVQVTRIIATTHCCVNPLLHVLLNRAFRRHLGRLRHLCGDAPPRPAEDAAHDASWAEHRHTTAV